MKAEISNNKQNPWIMAARPKTLSAAISPVIVAISISIYLVQFKIIPSLVALFCALMIQIGTNYVNDVIDYTKGLDRPDRLGPVRVTQAGLLTPRQVWTGAILCFLSAGMAGLALAFQSGWPVIWIGTASILAGYAYSAGPFPLVKIGLADLFVFIFFGFVAVCGSVWVISDSLPLIAWLSGVAVGVLTVNILVVNNIRDRISDRQAGRKNIPALLGRRAGEIEYLAMIVIAYLVPIMNFILVDRNLFFLLPILTVYNAIRLYRQLRNTPDGKALNKILGETAGFLWVYSITLSASYLSASLFR